MSAATIKEIMAEAFETYSQYEEIEFDFHGGEIALAFSEIVDACEWFWNRKWNKPHLCFATTNGTLIHGPVQDWFAQNKSRFWLGLSLDGTPEMHDFNRSGSYNMIDINFFLKTWPAQQIKMTISPDTLFSLAKGIFHIHNLGFQVSANLANGVDWSDLTYAREYSRQLQMLVDFYLSRPEIPPAKLLSFPLLKTGFGVLHPDLARYQHQYCGCGREITCYGPDGRKYPCQAFQPSTNAVDGHKVSQSIDFNDTALFLDQACSGCLLEYACPTCYGHNYFERGAMNVRDKRMCLMRKIEALASSYLYGMMLSDDKSYAACATVSPQEKSLMVEGIRHIQETYKNLLPETLNHEKS